MTDRPIIFSAPMVNAMLAGRKTQTRRVIKQASHNGWFIYHAGKRCGWYNGGGEGLLDESNTPYQVGDRLWVREGWRCSHGSDHKAPCHLPAGWPIEYMADGTHEWTGRNRSGMFMPRWASRLTLLVSDVQVQRLHDITEADAVAEGIIWSPPTDEDREWMRAKVEEYGWDDDMQGVWLAPGTRQRWGPKDQRDNPQWGPTAAFAYRCLWNSLHGPGSWDANPWVVALTFDMVRANISTAAE